MAHRIEVGLKEYIHDPRGRSVKMRLKNELDLDIDEVKTIDVFTLNFDLPLGQLKEIAAELLTDKIIHDYTIDAPLAREFDFLLEIGFKPGVTDNVGRTAEKNIGFYLNRELSEDEKVFTSVQYLFKGNITKEQLEHIAERILGNRLIERFIIMNRKDFSEYGVGFPMPLIKEDIPIKVMAFPLHKMSAKELIQLSKERTLVLNLAEFSAIRKHFSRREILAERRNRGLGKELTDVELEIFAQTWSEHCQHKEFNARVHYEDRVTGEKKEIYSLFKTYIKSSTEKIRSELKKIGQDYLVTVFSDNAGIVSYDDDTNFVFKVETHNSPSALDPYGGAITGIVGVNRDPAGTGRIGAKPFFNTDVFCFADPFYKKKLPPNTLHPMQIFKGVHEGVKDGGNQSGIPTVNGSLIFDERYLGKPLVYCGTGGFMPKIAGGADTARKVIQPGDFAVMIGGRVGKDGIHGATMSSEERHEGTPVTAVQIGDPITQKIMLDFLWEIKEKNYVKAITDNGAGGLSSSFGEIAQICGGVEIDTAKVPLKYHGLQPWEIFISESQERMSIAVGPEHLEKIQEYAKQRDVELSVVGTFNDSGFLSVKHGQRQVALIELDFLHNGTPIKDIEAVWEPSLKPEPLFEEPELVLPELKKLLSSLTICSKEHIVRAYDHEVKGRTIIKPLSGILHDGPSDAAVMAPKYGSYEAIVIGHGICPKYSDIDAYHMSLNAFDEMVRNIVATGGRVPDLENGEAVMWSVNDNFCCPDSVFDPVRNPDGMLKFARIVRACQALHDCSIAYNIPLTSGKDSMKNDFKYNDEEGNMHKISIPLTLLYSGVCKIEDYRKTVTIDVKRAGDLIYVLGLTKNELGGSEYFRSRGFVGNLVPVVDLRSAARLYKALGRAMENELIASCHDCSDGGLGVALLESTFSGGLGAAIDLKKVAKENIARTDYLLFSESASRFVVTIAPEHRDAFERMMEGHVFSMIGQVTHEPVFRMKKLSGQEEEMPVKELKRAWQEPLRFHLPLE